MNFNFSLREAFSEVPTVDKIENANLSPHCRNYEDTQTTLSRTNFDNNQNESAYHTTPRSQNDLDSSREEKINVSERTQPCIYIITNTTLSQLERSYKRCTGGLNSNNKLANLKFVIETIGTLSSKSQRLPTTITNYEKLRLSDHKTFIYIENHTIILFLFLMQFNSALLSKNVT